MKMPPIIDCILALVVCAAMPAKSLATIVVVRGKAVAWTRSGNSGWVEIRGEDGAVSRCRFDAETDFERERMSVPVTAIAPGDPVEMIAEQRSERCQAWTVEIARDSGPAAEALAPRGDFRFGGLVTARARSALTLRTSSGIIHVRLRRDTEYLCDGRRVDAQGLVNRHVFVRAGRNRAGDLEAYAVVWGELVGV